MVAFLRQLYDRLYRFIAQERLAERDCPPASIHAQLVAVLATAPLMWAYALLALRTTSSPWPGMVGLFASFVHLASPLLFRCTPRVEIPTHVFLFAGIVHQATFSYFTGGALSPIIIWFGVLPVLGGVILGRRGLLTWSLIAASLAVAFFLLLLAGWHFPTAISHEGFVVAQVLIVFGWMGIGLTVMLLHLNQGDESRHQLEQKNLKIDLLNAVMTHDFMNPVAIVRQNLYRLQQNHPKDGDIADAHSAVADLAEMIQRVSDYRTASEGRWPLSLEQDTAQSVFERLKVRFSQRCVAKEITLVSRSDQLHQPFWSHRSLWEAHVLGNLVDNAIKFSYHRSQVEIGIELFEGKLGLTVQDFGVGMGDTVRQTVWQPHAGLGTTGTEGEKGSGLGLTIARRFVELLGGSIEIVKGSELHRCGTRVEVLLPLPRPPA